MLEFTGYSAEQAESILLSSGGVSGVLTFQSKPERDAFLATTAGQSLNVTRVHGLTPTASVLLTTQSYQGLVAWDGHAVFAPDTSIKSAMLSSLPSMGYERPTWERHGFTGRDVKVAVIDSGIDAEHADLAGRVVAAQDFSSSGTTDDVEGHGTHVASIIGGSGAQSVGMYKGIAPQCLFINAKVFPGGATPAQTSWVLNALDWAVTEGADVVNMSLGSETPSDGTDALSVAVNAAVATGVVVVVSAGNEGPAASTVTSPGSAADAITVGAHNDAGAVASLSSRGPVGTSGMKPDLLAPGVSVTAARAGGSTFGTLVLPGYAAADGTSMACPHVAGICALIKQARPELSPLQVKRLLMQSCTTVAGAGVYDQGAGRIDAGSTYQWLRESMTLRFSTGLRNAWMTFSGLQSIMQYGVIEVYSGTQPASADLAPTGTLLARITANGLTFFPRDTSAGLFIQSTVAGELTNGGNPWTLKGIATGTATWFRWKWNGVDGDGVSTTVPRIDGSIPADLQLQSVQITPSSQFVVSSFRLVQPSF